MTGSPRERMLRHGWVGVAQVVAIAAIAVGAVVAVYGERTTLREGFDAMRGLRVGWLAPGIGAELLSMVALAQLERGLLRGVGATHTLRSVLATAYSANAISVSVPVVGSSIATAHAYKDFRRTGAAPEYISVALSTAGVFSSFAFAVVAAVGALMTGNPAAAAVALAAGAVLAAGLAAIGVSLRFPRARGWLIGRVIAVLRVSKRVIRRPRGDPVPLVTGTLERVSALRLGYLAAGQAFGWALVNWMADVACLVCAILAVGEPVPWTTILVIWSAGVGAASFSPVPAGLGIVDIVLIAALATAGLHGAFAVAAVVVYRIIALKVLISLGWIGFHYVASRRRAKRALTRAYTPINAARAPVTNPQAPHNWRRPTIIMFLKEFSLGFLKNSLFSDGGSISRNHTDGTGVLMVEIYARGVQEAGYGSDESARWPRVAVRSRSRCAHLAAAERVTSARHG